MTRRACPFGECDGSGWLLGPEDVARECRCRERRVRRARSRGVSSVIPGRYRGMSFDRPPLMHLRDTGAGRAVAAYVDALDRELEAGRGLWLSGPVGTGKTSLAMYVSRVALERGHTAAIYSMPSLLARIRSTYDAVAGEASYLELFDRLTAVDLLHLDDLGAERRTDWVIEQLYALVNARYEAQRPIMATTNLEPEQLEEQLGRRTVSRLLEMCGDPILLDGDDMRERQVATGGPLADEYPHWRRETS